MDYYPILFGGVTAGTLGFSLIAAWKSFKGAGGTALTDSDEKNYTLPPSKSKGFRRTSNILHVFPNGIIRTRDGGYVRGYEFTPSESFYEEEIKVRRLYDQFALLLTANLPKNSILQVRFDNFCETGELLNNQQIAMQENSLQCDPIAQLLKEEELNYYFDLTSNKTFRRGKFSAWLSIPASKTSAVIKTPFSDLKNFSFSNLKNLFNDSEKNIVCRYLADEEAEFEKAERYFRNFEQSFPTEIIPLTFEETAVRLRISNNPQTHSIPKPPADDSSDWSSYLVRTNITHQKNDWFVWHGRTPLTVISLFEPPESNSENPTCFPGLMRFLTTNPTLRERFTVVSEYIFGDKDQSVATLKKELKKMKETNTRPSGRVEFKDDKTRRIYEEKRQMLRELTSPGKSLINLRFHIIIQGTEILEENERKDSLRELERCAHKLIKLINENMQGAQADFEEPAALRDIYCRSLLGEMSPRQNYREIKEQALSLACFAPFEQDWNGMPNDPHSVFINTSGALVGVNLLRNPYAATPLTLILGSSGSGKSVLAAKLIADFLASVPNSRVRACDYGGSLAPLVNLFEGRYFRFSEKDTRTVNVWDYDGLEQQIPPDDEQIELVVKDTLILLGADEKSEIGKDFTAILEKCVRQVYADEVPRNAPTRRHEPRLSHLIRKLRTFPFESAEEKQNANKMAGRLETFEKNPWVDSETHPTFRIPSRFDVYELSSLEKLPDALRSCLAFRIGARVGTGDSEIEGIHPPTLVVYDEVHEYVHNEFLSYTLRGAEKTTRHGRKKNKIPILITHSFDDIKDFSGFTSNIGSIFVGKQDDITSLKHLRKWNDCVEQTIMSIENRKGIAHQFLFATGQGDNQKITTLQVYLSPIGLWTFTTEPPEDEARKLLQNALPHWSWSHILIALARRYERGLSAVGKSKIDADWLDELIRIERETNPNYRQYLREMEKINWDYHSLPEEINLDEWADDALELLDKEINKIKHDNFLNEETGEDLHDLEKLTGIPGVKVINIKQN